MAEVVGVVASALTLGDAVARLVKFCGSVKNAPQQLIAIKEDALLLEFVLKSLVKLSEDGAGLTVTEEWDICHRQCMVLTSDLQRLLSDLERKVVDRRVFGSIESVLKRDRVQELRERLRDAKANLGLLLSSRNLTNAFAVQVYKQQTLFNSLLAAQSSQLEVLVTGQQQLNESGNGMQGPFLSTQLPHRGTSHAPPTTVRPVVVDGPRKADKSTQSYYYQKRLRFLNWAARITFTHALGTWQHAFETYPVAHIESDVFEYTRTGNISKLQELFCSKAVSPFVRSYGAGYWNDMTLLHWAIKNLQVPTAQFLMSLHLDVNALADTDSYTPTSSLECLRLTPRPLPDDYQSSFLEMLRMVFDNPNCALLVGEESAHAQLEEWETTRYLYDLNDRRGLEADDIIHRNMFPPVEKLPLSVRLKRTCLAMRVTAIKLDEFDISAIWDHLGQESFDEQSIDLAISGDIWSDPLFPVWLALGHAKSGVQKKATDKQLAVWREILRQLIDNGASRLILEKYEQYLQWFSLWSIEVSVSSVADWLEHMITSWFLELKLAKMNEDDLAELRRGVAQHCLGAVIYFYAGTFFEDRDVLLRATPRLRVTGFSYAPSSGKPRIWSTPVWDEAAADFWHTIEADSVEDAICHIPGQWPSQDLQPVRPSEEEKMLEAVFLYYSQSKRRRRRAARYFGISAKDIDAEFGVSRNGCTTGPIFPPYISSRVRRAVRERFERIRARFRPPRASSRPNNQFDIFFVDVAEREEGAYDSWCPWTIFRVWTRGELWPDDGCGIE